MTSTLQPGQTFGRYQVVRTIGVGSFGVVYEAVQYPLGRRVALKLLHDRTLTHPDALARFEREAMAAARLQHPHVVEVFDYGAQDGVAFLVMELLEGESLQALMRRAGPLPVETLVDLTLPIVSAIAAVHDAGVVHRDLKPENVLLTVTPEGAWHPKLLDFGIAKMDGHPGVELTRTNALLGTPCYMSPEQVMQARAIDGRADQWSLGVVLYEALTGRKPFYSETLLVLMTAITSEDAPPLRAARPDVHPALEAVVARAMQRRPDDRYRTMRELGGALLPFASPAVQHAWYAEFVQGVVPAPQPSSQHGVANFAGPVEDATMARQPSLAHSSSRPGDLRDEPTELVNTTSQDGAFGQEFNSLRGVQGGDANATMHEPEGIGTGTLAMDVSALDLPGTPARPPTGKMPPYKSTVEMNSPVAPVAPPPAQPAFPMPPQQGMYPSMGPSAPPHVQSQPGAPMYGMAPQQGMVYGAAPGQPGGVGTISLASGEVPREVSGRRGGGRTFAIAFAITLLGASVFGLAWWKTRRHDPERPAATPPAHVDAAQGASATPTPAPDASPAATPDAAPAATPDAAASPDAAALVADALAPDVAPLDAVPAAVDVTQPLDAAVAALADAAADDEDDDVDAAAPRNVRAPRPRRDAGARPPGGVRRPPGGGRRPPGGAAPIF